MLRSSLLTSSIGGGQYDPNTSSLGDAKLLGRFQGLTTENNICLIVGVKLPTGSHGLSGTSIDSSAPGLVTIDPGLQPGTGTTDLILGLSYNKSINKNWDYFSEGWFQSALGERDNYRRGDGFNFNLGTRYFGN